MPATTVRSRATSDPFERALRPPADETEEARKERLHTEALAKQESDRIDEAISRDRKERAKKKQDVSVLLLGQSESGKSTTLKQFQLVHVPSAFQSERGAWRFVIYLNLIRSLRRILDALAPDFAPDGPDDEPDSPRRSRPPSAFSMLTNSQASSLEILKRRLGPVLLLEEQLFRQLSTSDEDEATRLVYPGDSLGRSETALHGRSNWRSTFGIRKQRTSREGTGDWWDDPDDPHRVLSACSADMIALWTDPLVQDILKKRRVRLEESSGFYLDQIERITAKGYAPTDDDILKARLKTLGVQEHMFTVSRNTSVEKASVWKVYDVGGARNQRQAWAPYFEEVDAIIFLAPISAFDQVLAEDFNVNRMEDSLLLWKNIISNKLLKNVNIVLFLNKCDLLKAKLKSGTKLATYMVSYGNRPNTYEDVSKYFHSKFIAIHTSFTPNKDREVYVHLTSVVDQQSTADIIVNVRDIILRNNLKSSRLI